MTPPSPSAMTLHEALDDGYGYCSHPAKFLIGSTVKMRGEEDNDGKRSIAYVLLQDQIEVEWARSGLNRFGECA